MTGMIALLLYFKVINYPYKQSLSVVENYEQRKN